MVTLRPFTTPDVALVLQQFYGPGAGPLQWFGFSAPPVQRDLEEHGLLTPEGGRLVVDDGTEAVGAVQWFRDHWGPPVTSWCWEIGIALRADRRGQGLGTQAQVLLRDYLFDHTRAERIQATTDVENIAEQRALEKAGFRQEGCLRSAQWRAGAWHDQYLYATVRADR